MLDRLDGCQQPIVLGALAGAAGCPPAQTAVLAMHHLAAAVASAGTPLLGLDPFGVLAAQARATTLIAELVEPADHMGGDPARRAAGARRRADRHPRRAPRQWDARLFAA